MPWWLTSPLGSADPPFTEMDADDIKTIKQIAFEHTKQNGLWSEAVGTSTGHVLPAPERSLHVKIVSEHTFLKEDFVGAFNGWAVSERVIAAIEDLEPGVHGFWPVDFSFENGENAGRRWLMNIGNRLQTLDLEKSKVKGNLKASDGHLVPDFLPAAQRPLKEGPQLLFCKKERVQGHAIWCEYRLRKTVFISEELYDLFAKFEPSLSGIDFELQASLA